MRRTVVPRGYPFEKMLHSRSFVVAALLCLAPASMAQSDPDLPIATSERIYKVPLFLSTANPDRHGFLRIVNRSGRAGNIRISALDELGARFGPVFLDLAEGVAIHLTSGDLENGNSAKALSGGVGSGHGDWRLELSTALDISVLSFARTVDGLVARLDGTTDLEQGGRCLIDFFNPASNDQQSSQLRFTNPGIESAEIVVEGTDDDGMPAAGGPVRLTVHPGQSCVIAARDLESGAAGLRGQLGDGSGKWRLSVSTDLPIEVTNLLVDQTGKLTIPAVCQQSSYPRNVVVNENGPKGAVQWGTDAYELSDAVIAGDTLTATVSYGGGCEDHVFTLVLSSALSSTAPARLEATLAHNANKDPCEAWLTEQIEFDLTAVKKIYRDATASESGVVVLVVSLSDATVRELTYVF